VIGAVDVVARQYGPGAAGDAGTAALAGSATDPFRLATWEELLALLDENGPDELLRQVRAAEAVDPEGRQWPRTKRSDDATVAYLVLNEGQRSS
jgi:hypothetical protein